MAPELLTLGELGETKILQSLLGRFPSPRPSEPGDDCAVLRLAGCQHDLLLKTDAVVEGVHYTAEMPPERAGRKALARALSDVAAMGGRPTHALLTLFAPPSDDLERWKRFVAGFRAAARRWGLSLAGGELSSSPARAASVAVLGWVRRGGAVLRSGGRPGQALYVTGRLGGSLARKHWAFAPRLAEGQWLAQEGFARAMMDLSDGLAADLPRLAAASHCGFELEPAAIPRTRGCTLAQAMSDGEDYELVFAVEPSACRALESAWRRRFPKLPITRIGLLTPKKHRPRATGGGWDHFLCKPRLSPPAPQD